MVKIGIHFRKLSQN